MSSSSTDNSEHLLAIFVKEPIEGAVKPSMAKDSSTKEAWLRYQSIVNVLLIQLKGLEHTDIWFLVSGKEAAEAVQFWLLPQFQGDISPLSHNRFQFSPEGEKSSFSISFMDQPKRDIHSVRKQGFNDYYKTVSFMGANCPSCGSRWVHMAQLLAKSKSIEVKGIAQDDSIYLTTTVQETKGNYELPVLEKIKTQEDWERALESGLSGKLRTAYKAITGKTI